MKTTLRKWILKYTDIEKMDDYKWTVKHMNIEHVDKDRMATCASIKKECM